MDKENYLKDYEAAYDLRSDGEYEKSALHILEAAKEYWTKEKLPRPKGLKGLLAKNKTGLLLHTLSLCLTANQEMHWMN